MDLDLRLPIGLMFTVLGAIVAIFGLMSDPELYHRSLDVNINLSWGCVLLVFGLVMLWLGRGRASR